MKATLKFNLPEEQDAFNDAIYGRQYRQIIRDTFDFVRRSNKSDENLSAEDVIVFMGQSLDNNLVEL